MRFSDWSSDVCSSDLDALDFPAVKAGTVRALLGERVDEELFRLSRHFVGDTAETAALLWPEKPLPFREGVGVGHVDGAQLQQAPPRPSPEGEGGLSISQAVDALSTATRSDAPAILASLLDRLDADGRYALLKLAPGRSKERRVGKECVSKCRSRGSPYH